MSEATTERLALGVEEAAAAVGIGRTAMFQLIGRGDVRSIKVGRRRLVPVEALEDWLRREAGPRREAELRVTGGGNDSAE